MIAELRDELRVVMLDAGTGGGKGAGDWVDGAGGVGGDVPAISGSGDGGSDGVRLSHSGRSGRGEGEGGQCLVSTGVPLPVLRGGAAVDWAAVYADVDRTRQAVDTARVDERRKHSAFTTSGDTAGAAGAGEGEGAVRGSSRTRTTDWEAAYAEIERTKAEAAAGRTADADADDEDDQAACRSGGGSEGEGEVEGGNEGMGVGRDGTGIWNAAGTSGALVGDLYRKLAALGALGAGEVLMQSPTVQRQLSRMQL